MEKKFVIGGFQEHQKWRDDGICPSLTAAMGMGGGRICSVCDYRPIKLGCFTGKSEGNSVYSTEGSAMCICSGPHGWASGYILEMKNSECIRLGNYYGSQFGTSFGGNVYDSKDGNGR